MKSVQPITIMVCCALLSACVSLSSERQFKADEIATSARLEKITVQTDPFVLTAYYRIKEPGKPIRVYIEGDGYARATQGRPSGDPTPRNPIGLGLASKDFSPNVVCLARPCQYDSKKLSPACREYYWTQGRFSEEVVNSMDQAISYFVKKADAPAVELVGYSGGAAVAVLVAGRRADIQSLRTAAGNLNPALVNEPHHATPFGEGSLNPMDVAPSLVRLPQIHFIGADDNIISPKVAESFFMKMKNGNCFQAKTLREASHEKGWVESWGRLLAWPPRCWNDFD